MKKNNVFLAAALAFAVLPVTAMEWPSIFQTKDPLKELIETIKSKKLLSVQDQKNLNNFIVNNKIDLYQSLGPVYHDYTLLHIAAEHNNAAMIRFLLSLVSNPLSLVNAVTTQGISPLHVAVNNNSDSAAESLVQNRADIDTQDTNKQTPLHYAVKNQNKKIVDLLLKKKANPNIKDIDGNTPLHYATGQRNNDLIDLLLINGADPNIQNAYGETPLHFAIHNNSRKAVQLLLNRGANPSLRSTRTMIGGSGLTALEIARNTQNIDPEIINLLQTAIQAPQPSLPQPITHDNIRNIINILRQGGALTVEELNRFDVTRNNVNDLYNIQNSLPDQQATLLHLAAYYNSPQTINALISLGANINIQSIQQQLTPLHVAILRGNTAAMDALLEHNPNVNLTSVAGFTPLHYATIMVNDVTTTKKLLNQGANINARDREGRTPVQLAVGAVKEVLEEAAKKERQEQKAEVEEILPVIEREQVAETPEEEGFGRPPYKGPKELFEDIADVIPGRPVKPQPAPKPEWGKPFAWTRENALVTALGGAYAAMLGYLGLREVKKEVVQNLSKAELYVMLSNALIGKEYEYAYRLAEKNTTALRQLSDDIETKNYIQDLIHKEEIAIAQEAAENAASMNPFKRLFAKKISIDLNYLVNLWHLLENPEHPQ